VATDDPSQAASASPTPSSTASSLKPQASSLKPPTSFRPFRLVRRFVESLVLLAIAALVVDSFLVDGWLAPSVVSSGSMAPAILGPHREGRCAACGRPLVCEAADPAVNTLDCPNCGRADNPLDPRVFDGDRLIVDRAAFALRPPRRWDVVVFHCPSHAQMYCVKRIVGLPGETVEVRDGDVYINGQIARKTLAEQRATAILVNDTAYRDPKLPPRWQQAGLGSGTGSGTKQIVGGQSSSLTLRPNPSPYLEYVHDRRVRGAANSVEETPIRDNDFYNPTTSRRLNDVTDLMLDAQLRISGAGELRLRANDGREVFELTIDIPSGKTLLKCDGRYVKTIQLVKRLVDRPVEIVLSTFEHRLLLAFDGQTELVHDYAPAAGQARPISRPFAIASAGIKISVQRLRVFRDVYYTPPTHAVDSLARKLGPDEYFVLGDNSPISADSREWMGGETVPARLIVGRVLSPSRGRE
jgi:signal peptidase I